MMKKILLVGPYPPPFGGISVQVQRIKKVLDRLSDYECHILNIGENRTSQYDGAINVKGYGDFIKKLLSFAQKRYVIHIITSGHNFKSWLSALCCCLIGFINSRHTIVTLGSGMLPEYLKKSGWLFQLVIILTLKLAGLIVCRNNESINAIARKGVATRKIFNIPGFLGVSEADIGKMSSEMISFKRTHNPVIGIHVIKDPEYGLDFILDSLDELIIKFPNLGVFLIGIDQRDLPVTTIRIDKHIFCTGSLEHSIALALMKQIRLFVRATTFDGDSNSVREALAVGTPVIASKTDFRPNGTILFEIGNSTEMIDQITNTINLNLQIDRKIVESERQGNLGRLLKLYDSLYAVCE